MIETLGLSERQKGVLMQGIIENNGTCFPQTYPYCINHHSGLVVFGISNAG